MAEDNKTQIRFYHLMRSPFEQALPQILSKALERGMRAFCYGHCDEGRLQALNDYLWRYDEKSFIPHGTKKEGHADHQPVWLDNSPQNANQANLLILFDGARAEKPDEYEMVCYFFDGNRDDWLNEARAYWKELNDSKLYALSYWQQNQKGGWVQKA